MEEWKSIRLGDIVRIGSGLAYKADFLGSGDALLLGMGCVSFTEKFLKKGARPYSGKSEERYIVSPGDIVLATRQQSDNLPILGMPAIIPDDYLGTRLIAGSNLYIVHNHSDIDNRFLYWLLKTPEYINHISSCKTGTTVRMITKKDVESFVFKCPPKNERERIADFLWSIEEKIDLNLRINHNLEEFVQYRFDQLLLANGAKGYCQVADYIDINPKRVLKKGQFARSIEMSFLSTSGSFPSGWDFKEYNGGMKFVNGDTIMARITPCLENGKVAYVDFLDDKETAFGSTEYIVLRSKPGIPSAFTYFLARNSDFVDYATKNMNGSSGRQRVSGDVIGRYCIPILNDQDLSIFAEVSQAAMNVIRINSIENIKLASTRDTLLPLLLSGEIPFNHVTC